MYNNSVMLDKEFRQNLKDLSTGRFIEIPVNLQVDAEPPFEVLSYEKTEVKGVGKKVDQRILLQVQLTMEMMVSCHRCLDDAEYTYNIPLEILLEEEDLDRFSVERWVQEEIILHSPLRILCSEDCKGLCPDCGKNLKEGNCNCKDRQKNSPFDVLDSLFD